MIVLLAAAAALGGSPLDVSPEARGLDHLVRYHRGRNIALAGAILPLVGGVGLFAGSEYAAHVPCGGIGCYGPMIVLGGAPLLLSLPMLGVGTLISHRALLDLGLDVPVDGAVLALVALPAALVGGLLAIDAPTATLVPLLAVPIGYIGGLVQMNQNRLAYDHLRRHHELAALPLSGGHPGLSVAWTL